MDPKQVAKQVIKFNKRAFDNTFNAMTVLQEQMEKMMIDHLEQGPWMTVEAKKTVTNWIQAYQRGREDFKATVDDINKKVEDFLAGADKGKVEDFLVNIEKTGKTKAGK